MNEVLKKLPVPIVGTILGLASAGNLIQSYGEVYRNIFGIISTLVLILMSIKIVKYPKSVAESLENPIVSSVFPTLDMAIMVLSTYIEPYAPVIGRIIWIMGLTIHIILIFWFTKKFTLNFKIEQVLPTWLVVYVGIAVASVTGPTHGLETVGQVAFWLGVITLLIFLPIIIYRVMVVKEMPEQTLPTLAIFSAPASLLLSGYLNSFQMKNLTIVYFLAALSISMYTVVIIMLFKLLKLKFYPSYSAFTFPLVISGIAMKLANEFLIKSGHAIPELRYLILFQEAVGVMLTLYVLFRYVKFLLWKEDSVIKVPKTL